VSKYKTVIFDFDGTIVDTFGIVVDIINKDHIAFGIDHIDLEELPRLRDMSIKYLLEEFGVNVLKFPSFLSKIRKELAKRIYEAKIFDGMEVLFKEINKLGIEQGIITNNYVKNVTDVFSDEQEKMFKFIRSEKRLFGKHHEIRKVIKEQGYKKDDVLYIGDEVSDIEACQKVGIDVIAVTWGFNSKKVLQKHKPTYIADNPTCILDIIIGRSHT